MGKNVGENFESSKVRRSIWGETRFRDLFQILPSGSFGLEIVALPGRHKVESKLSICTCLKARAYTDLPKELIERHPILEKKVSEEAPIWTNVELFLSDKKIPVYDDQINLHLIAMMNRVISKRGGGQVILTGVNVRIIIDTLKKLKISVEDSYIGNSINTDINYVIYKVENAERS